MSAKKHLLTVRLSDDEQAEIVDRAKGRGCTVSDWCRWKLGLSEAPQPARGVVVDAAPGLVERKVLVPRKCPACGSNHLALSFAPALATCLKCTEKRKGKE